MLSWRIVVAQQGGALNKITETVLLAMSITTLESIRSVQVDPMYSRVLRGKKTR